MSATDVFYPAGNNTVNIAATATTSSVSLTNPIAANSPDVRIYNAGPNTVFVRWGIGAQTALATDMPIPAGAIENFYKAQSDTFAAICAATQTATVYFTPGTGI
jgi:hypothetical protein